MHVCSEEPDEMVKILYTVIVSGHLPLQQGYSHHIRKWPHIYQRPLLPTSCTLITRTMGWRWHSLPYTFPDTIILENEWPSFHKALTIPSTTTKSLPTALVTRHTTAAFGAASSVGPHLTDDLMAVIYVDLHIRAGYNFQVRLYF